MVQVFAGTVLPYMGGNGSNGRLHSECLGSNLNAAVAGITSIALADNAETAFAIRIFSRLLSSLILGWPLLWRTRPYAELLKSTCGRLVAPRLVLLDQQNLGVAERLDILISDSATYTNKPHLKRWIPRTGMVLLWDSLLKKALQEDPFFIQHILTNTHSDAASSDQVMFESLPRSRRAAPPFRKDEIYLLLGGIGGLGIDLAVWMYQHGARHLVLTSRRGSESPIPTTDAMTIAKLAYLQNAEGLELQLAKCDAIDATEMNTLIQSFSLPVAGCFLMTLVLSDALFFNQTDDTFSGVYASKLKAFEVVSQLISIQSLDFLVAISSISGLLGIPGQTNYASACTALDGALAHYSNAFSLIAPGIIDAGYIDRSASQHILKDSLSTISAEADGLAKLDDRPFNQYIPELDWGSINQHFKIPTACRQLITHSLKPLESPRSRQNSNSGEALLPRVLELLEVSPSDFDATQPLTQYGLDSISAAKLANTLRPYGSFSQLQLLGGVSSCIARRGPTSYNSRKRPSLRTIPESSAEALIEICYGESGAPTIILPGANGVVGMFFGLQEHFRGGPLWAIQITDSTPTNSLEAVLAFWKQQIREKWPHGPYRLAGYSASSLFCVALAKMFEEGEEVIQLTFLDHFPMLWVRIESELSRDKSAHEIHDLADRLGYSVLEMLRADPTVGRQIVANYEMALLGSPDAPPHIRVMIRNWNMMIPLLLTFLQDRTYADRVNEWISSVKAPFVLVVAEYGIAGVPIGWMA
ncbi:KR domain-containing protein [Favolaschia claudopus]|uniref:KR domain-containing protein n=1 Tax=Favolaschia claudopus TaxID=2862362 RepID=A0AAW0CS69_9AGAR